MRVQAPNRVQHSYTQHLCGPPGEVFPLLCPVREVEWVEGWAPSRVLSESGLAEPGCVFITPGLPVDAVWVITRHDSEAFLLELVKVIPDVVVGQFSIRLHPADGGSTADITYGYTSLSEHGDEVLAGFTEEHFRSFMSTWEAELNHFLSTGRARSNGTGDS